MMKSVIAAGKRAMSSRPKRSRNEGENLRGAVNQDYAWVSGRKMLAMKWKCDTFLESQGLHDDFAWLANNAGMGVFSNFHYLTYRAITLEFLSSFEHTLDDSRVPPRCSFTLGGVPRTMTLAEWCTVFGFENRGVLDSKGVVIAEASGTWDLISVKDEHDFAGRKVSSIQNPAIRYFMTFIANTIFGRENLGGMSSYDMCVLHAALHPNATPKLNLGAFLMIHFRRQHKQPSGTILIGGLVTHLAEHFGLNLEDVEHVAGPTELNRRVMTNYKFVGPVQGDICYKCPLPNTNTVPVRLPLPQAFSVITRQMWVLSIEELNEFRHAAGFGNDVHPEPAPEWDATAEGVAHNWEAWGMYLSTPPSSTSVMVATMCPGWSFSCCSSRSEGSVRTSVRLTTTLTCLVGTCNPSFLSGSHTLAQEVHPLADHLRCSGLTLLLVVPTTRIWTRD